MTNALQTREELPIVEASQPRDPMELYAMAIQGKADVAVLERLEAMQERFDKRKAKRLYDESLAAFQAECPVVLKSVEGAQGKYRFAPMDHILQIVQPILKKHGFSWSVTNPVRDGFVKCIVTIKHNGGHSEQSEFEVPVEVSKTRDGRDIMSAPQSYGSARTFCLRYAFVGALGILTADEDRDGQTARQKVSPWLAEKMDKPKASAQPSPIKTKLWAACKPIRGSEQSWDVAEAWMVRKAILKPGQKVAALTDAEMADALDKVTIELTGN